MDELFSGYIEDFKDNLISLNEALLELENATWDKDTINRLFRVAHTIKGNSAAVEFYNIEKVMHSMEDILYGVRNGTKELTDKIIRILYVCHDFLEDCIHVLMEENHDHRIEISGILQKIKESVADCEEEPPHSQDAREELSATAEAQPYLGEDLDIWLTISENVKRGYHAYKLEITIDDTSSMKSIRAWMVMQKVESEASCLYSNPEMPAEDKLRSGEFEFDGQVIHMIILTENHVEGLAHSLRSSVGVAELTVDPITSGQIEAGLFSLQQAAPPAPVEAVQPTPKQSDVPAAADKARDASGIQAAEKEAQASKAATASAGARESKPSAKKDAEGSKQDTNFIRVPATKVDHLMDMLGELLIINSQLEQNAGALVGSDSSFINNLSRMAKIIKNVQSVSMSLRMVEIKPTLHRLTRIIRDTAVELDKKITIAIEGEEIEIDRGAAEKLFDPLMHLVRNAVSHGIESEEARLQAGKKAHGLISIKAYKKRGDVYIEIADDGRGMDTQKILAKAVSLKMADELQEYSEEQIIRFIFMAGFSTQVEINNISGRGVGMNVVESEIKKMGGRVDITNRFGHGCTFTVRIPMNLAVVNGTIVKMAGGRYIIPTLFIREFFIVGDKDKISMQGQISAVRVREHIIPIVRAESLFHLAPTPGQEECREFIILELEQKLLALPVEKILGRQEVVSKPLNDEVAGSGLFSGVSILGDGNVSLILDVEAVFNEIHL